LDRVVKLFLIKFRDSSGGSEVLLQLGFKMRFSLFKKMFVPRTYVPKFRNLLK
jgi:hypothetical protein